ncbi:MAG: class I tRNA ligase family protein, partial [Candidatus Obscuribacterales bacterium]|nr:class I tRNA ligase family protein [Candidatus Obscuribacterales bacterium]
PEEVVGAPETKTKRQVKNIFMELPDSSDLDGRGIHQSILEVYEKFANVQEGLLRLTANSEWGLQIEDQENGDRFFNYPFAYAYALMLGEIAGLIAGTNINALSSDSDIVTVAAFGIDNTIPVLGSIEGITASLKQYKQFDYYLVNHFLDLDGSKFSTSRRHAIWVDDAINKLGASSDIIRLYLATIDIRTGTGNVSGQELLEFYNQTIDWIENRVVDGVAELAVALREDEESKALQAPGGIVSPEQTLKLPGSADELLLETLATLLVKMEDALNPENYRLFDAVKAIDEWLDFGASISKNSQDYFWWLKGLVLLVYPFMPRLGETLWITLGYSGEPRIANFTALPAESIQQHLPTNLRRLTQADVDQLSGVTIS